MQKPGDEGIINTEVLGLANSIKEAEQWVLDHGLCKAVNYKGCDLVTANEWNKVLYEAIEQYPALRDRMEFVGECHERNAYFKRIYAEQRILELMRLNPNASANAIEDFVAKELKVLMRQLSISKGTYAQSCRLEGICGITVNKEWGKDSRAFVGALHDDVERKYHPIGCDTIRSIADHEIGHQIDDLLGLGGNRAIQDIFYGYQNNWAGLTDELSEYAWNNGSSLPIREFIAEAYAECCNNPKPREIARKIGEIIRRERDRWLKSNTSKK